MKNFTGNILALAVLFILVGLIAGAYQKPPNPPLTPPTPAYTMLLRPDEFHVANKTLTASGDHKRIFNHVTELSDDENDPFYQIQILGTNLLFGIEEDSHSRILNVYLIPDNARPHQISNLKTYVATARNVQFLVHKNARGYIVGASPPPNQEPRPAGYVDPHETEGEASGHHQPEVSVGPQRPRMNMGSDEMHIRLHQIYPVGIDLLHPKVNRRPRTKYQ